MALATSEGRETARDYRRAFNKGFAGSLWAAARFHRTRFWEHGVQQRIIVGKDRVNGWQVRQHNHGAIEPLLASGQSFILAFTNFGRDHRAFSVLMPDVIPFPNVFLIAREPDMPTDPRTRRIYVQYQNIRRSLEAFSPGMLQPKSLGNLVGVPRQAIRHLQNGRGVVSIMIDSPWHESKNSGFSRPFAGSKKRHFATGAATLARLCQCPIVLYFARTRLDGSVDVYWNDPVPPPSRADHEADREVTNRLLDLIEKEVGCNPCDYLAPIGAERKWAGESIGWVDGDQNAWTSSEVNPDASAAHEVAAEIPER